MFQPKLGASLHTIATELTDEALQAVAGSKIATLEFFPTLFDGERGEERKAALLEMLAASGIQPRSVHALFGGAYDISVLDDDARQKAIASVGSAIVLATELGARIVVVHASAEPIAPEERPARFDAAQDALSMIGTFAEMAGVRVAVELLPRSCLGNTVEELLALLEGLPKKTFGVCLDTNHLMDRWQTLPQEIRRLGIRLITTHLSDYDGVDEKHWLPGRGVIDWAAALAALRAIGYRGPFNCECKLQGTAAERIAALERSFEWLAGL